MVAKGDMRPALWPKTPCCAGPCPKARVLPKQRRLLQPGHAGHTASSERCRHVAGSRPGFAAPSTLAGKFLINKCPSTNPFFIHPVSKATPLTSPLLVGRDLHIGKSRAGINPSGVHGAPWGAEVGENRVGRGREHPQPEAKGLQVQSDGNVPPSAKDP